MAAMMAMDDGCPVNLNHNTKYISGVMHALNNIILIVLFSEMYIYGGDGGDGDDGDYGDCDGDDVDGDVSVIQKDTYYNFVVKTVKSW